MNKTILFSIFSVFILTLINCTSSKKETPEYLIEKSSIAIGIDSISLNFYPVFCHNTKENHLYGYNSKTHNIDIFDIGTKHFLSHIFLQKEGPNGIRGQISGIYYQSTDSIFLQDNTSIYIIDNKGIIRNKYELRSFFKDPLTFFPIANSYFKLQFFPDTRTVYNQNLYIINTLKDNLESSLITEINLDSNLATVLPISFSKFFQRIEGQVGYQRWMNFESSKNDSLFFSSQFDDQLFIYNRRLKTVHSVDLENELLKKTSRLPINSTEQEWLHHSVENDHRFAFLYDEWKNLFYRFIWKGIDAKQSDNRFNLMIDKPMSLEIYDSYFQLKSTIDFPKYTYRPNTWFVTEQGIFINTAHPKSNDALVDSLKYDILNIVLK